ncbi:MAG: cytochrome c [Thermoanaerobaculia bacterium]|nr:cytochrome c [Thermoanaerobaculia bacterium]
MRTCAGVVFVMSSLLAVACGGGEKAEAPLSSTDPAAPSASTEGAAATDSTTAPTTTGDNAAQATTTSGTSPWAPPATTAPAPPVPTVVPIAKPSGTGTASNGASIYATKCASCHGVDARGDTAMGKKYGMKDFRSPEVRALTTSDLAQIMKLGNGKLSEGAHPKANLSDQDVKDMVAFIQAMK